MHAAQQLSPHQRRSVFDPLRTLEPEECGILIIDDESGLAKTLAHLRRFCAPRKPVHPRTLSRFRQLRRRNPDLEIVALRDRTHDPERTAMKQMLGPERPKLTLNHDP